MVRSFAFSMRFAFLAAMAAWCWTSRAASSGLFALDLRQVKEIECETTDCRVTFSDAFALDLRYLSDTTGEVVVRSASAAFKLDLRNVVSDGGGAVAEAFGEAFILDLRNVKDESGDKPQDVPSDCVEASSFAFVLDLREIEEPDASAYATSAGFTLDLRQVADQTASDTSVWAIASSGTFSLDLRAVIGVASGAVVVLASSDTFELDLRKITVEGVIIVPGDMTGGKAITISEDWVNNELDAQFGAGTGVKFGEMYGYDLKQALTKPTGKYDAKGDPLLVWHDYVAGTDPTNPESVFQARVEMVDGTPIITWSPALNGEGVQFGTRRYRIFATDSLGGDWAEVSPDAVATYRFFTVTVEMP